MTPLSTAVPVNADAPVSRKPFQIPSLDGLRAVSFFTVFLGHAFAKRWIPGDLGLIVFFFLSGYLITTLLRLEFDETGKISFRDFYLRRILRIFPPLYLVLGLDCLLTLTHVLDNTLWPRAVLAQACHLTNYWIVFHGWWNGLAPGSWIFWSLAVEEHFYLVFPLLYLLMRRRQMTAKQQALALLGLCAAVLAWRCVLVFGLHAAKDRLYVATDTRVDSILFGCILAVWNNPALDAIVVPEKALKMLWVPLGFCALAASFVIPKVWPGFEQTFRYTLQGVALFPVFVAAIKYPTWGAFRWLNVGWVRTAGLLSYSLYLLHTTVLYGVHHWLHGSDTVLALPALAISVALAALIYVGVEKPCGRLRRRLSHVLAGRGTLKDTRKDTRKDNGPDGSNGSGAVAEGTEPPQTGTEKVARNVVATLATQLISWGLTFAVTLYLPRYVGDVGLGKLAFAASFVAVFGVIVPLGTSTLLVKEIARDRSRTGELLLAALALRLPLGLLVAGLAVGLASLLGYPPLTRVLVTMAALGMLAGTINDAFGAALQGQENLTRQSVGVLVNKFLGSALTILLIFRHAPLWTLAAIGIWTGLASLVVNASAFRPLLPTLHLPSQKTIRHVAVAGLPFMGWIVFQTLYGQTDPIVLSLVTNDKTVGWYAAAFRLIGTTLFLPTALATALMPTLSRLYREDSDGFKRLARRLLSMVMLCGVPISLVLLLLPDRLITLLHYPAGFVHSVPVLRVGSAGVLLWFAGNALGTTIFAADGQARMFRTSVIASLLGIPLCAAGSWLASRFLHNGAIGAIGSDVLLEMYLVWSYLRLLPAGTLGGESVQTIGRCVVAALPMAGLLAFLSAHGWGLWSLPPCVAVYVGMCVALGCLRVQDLTMARQAFARKA